MPRTPLSRILILALGLLVALAGTAPAEPKERRVALVMGNGAYRQVAPLSNPANDAQLMAETLKALGFELVGGKALVNLQGKAEMEQAVQRFGVLVRGADVGLFFYAGHGVQVDGKNYLVPVGADVAAKTQIKYQLLDADFVLDELAAASTRVNVVILDACRNNPFGDRGLRDAKAGLAQIMAPRGTLVAYSTAPGRTASDGTGKNSAFSSALARNLRQPGQRIDDVFMRVGAEVEQATGGEQSPWKSDNLRGVFCLSGPCGQPGPAASLPAPAPAAPSQTIAPTPAQSAPAPSPGYAAPDEARSVAPGDPAWDLGLSKGRRASHEVAHDTSVRTPQGQDSFRVDFNFPAGLTDYFAGLISRSRWNLSGYAGIEFAMKGTKPVTAYFNIVTSQARGQKIADRFYIIFRADTQWKTQRIAFRDLLPSIPWRQRWAAVYGYTPGDGVLHPELTEELRIGLDVDRNTSGPGSFWVGDIRFYR